MWRNKWIICLLCCVLLLAGCTVRPQTADPVESFPTAPEAIYKTTTVTRGTFVLSDKCPATHVYPLNEVLTCEYSGAILDKPIKFSTVGTRSAVFRNLSTSISGPSGVQIKQGVFSSSSWEVTPEWLISSVRFL